MKIVIQLQNLIHVANEAYMVKYYINIRQSWYWPCTHPSGLHVHSMYPNGASYL